MPLFKVHRVKRSYSPTGRTVRAAFDFATKSPYFRFWSDCHDLLAEELRKKAIEMFEAREVKTATFSWLIPEGSKGRNLFHIEFRPMANGFVPKMEIEIKSVEDLRAKAKTYKADATAYSETRKPKPKLGNRNIDKTL